MALTVVSRPDYTVEAGLVSKWVAVGHDTNSAIYHFNVYPFPTTAYYLEVAVYNADTLEEIGTKQCSPDPSGSIYFDAAPFLRKEFVTEYPTFASGDNEKDTNNSLPFYITYTEVVAGVAGTPVSDAANTLYALNAVRKPGLLGGSNIGRKAMFDVNTTHPDNGQFLTKFKVPTYFPGYPFSLRVAKSDQGTTVYQEEALRDNQGDITSTLVQQLPNTDFNYLQRLTLNTNTFGGAPCMSFLLSLDGNGFGCAGLTPADWAFNQWQLDFNSNELLQIVVEPSISGLIQSVTTFPGAGILYDSDNNVVENLSHTSGGVYVPDNPVIISGGPYRFEVLNVAVDIGGTPCTLDFIQEFTAAGASTGEYEANDYDNSEYNT